MRKFISVLLSLSLSLMLLCASCASNSDSVTPPEGTAVPVTSAAVETSAGTDSVVEADPPANTKQEPPVTDSLEILPVTETPTQFGDYQLYWEDDTLYISRENGTYTSLFEGRDVEWSWITGAWCDGSYAYVSRSYVDGDYVEADWEDDNGMTEVANYSRVYAVDLSDGTIIRMSATDTPTTLAYARGTCLFWTEYSNWNSTSGSTYLYDTSTGEKYLLRAGWCVEGGIGDFLYGEQDAPGGQDPMPAEYMDLYSLTDRTSIYLCDRGDFDKVDEENLYFFSLTQNDHSLTVGRVTADGTITENLATVNYNGWEYGVAAKMKDNSSFYYDYLVDDYDWTYKTYLYNFDTGEVTEVENEYF